ncbi:hypothetical protein QBC44DRAFT_113249 [Cladorrhinum sp. PSN332]|nr:hypothetical protein QBC44DRAFT_113249 [Cladorrhinum sp. PSN332]
MNLDSFFLTLYTVWLYARVRSLCMIIQYHGVLTKYFNRRSKKRQHLLPTEDDGERKETGRENNQKAHPPFPGRYAYRGETCSDSLSGPSLHRGGLPNNRLML